MLQALVARRVKIAPGLFLNRMACFCALSRRSTLAFYSNTILTRVAEEVSQRSSGGEGVRLGCISSANAIIAYIHATD